MADTRTRRQEYADATRAALVETATELFVEHGYQATSIEEICRRARVSSGALYHHFKSKRELFVAVFEAVQIEAIMRSVVSVANEEPSWDAVAAGLRAYLSLYLDRRYLAITLIEGPAALGWREWRDLDQRYALPPLEIFHDRLIAAGVIEDQPRKLLARVICAAIAEAAMSIGESEDPREELERAVKLLTDLSRGLSPPG